MYIMWHLYHEYSARSLLPPPPFRNSASCYFSLSLSLPLVSPSSYLVTFLCVNIVNLYLDIWSVFPTMLHDNGSLSSTFLSDNTGALRKIFSRPYLEPTRTNLERTWDQLLPFRSRYQFPIRGVTHLYLDRRCGKTYLPN